MTVHVDRSVRLPETQFFAGPQRKTGIALHHTVGAAARTTVAHWRTDRAAGGGRRCIATAYVIECDGTVFEVFDPAAWAYQFGLRWPLPARLAFEQRFIGIELASEGGLIERHGILYAFDTVSPRTLVARAEAFDCGRDYRGYRWFDRYEPTQLAAVGRLVDELCTRFPIPRQYPDQPFDYYGDALAALPVGARVSAGSVAKVSEGKRPFRS